MMEAMNLAGSASLSSSDPASRAASHASEERYRRTVAEVENAIENLLHEDEARNTADRKYPKFSGADEKQEDFQKFEKDVREVFKANRVERDDQVKKLCEECLESPAKNLIPETVKTLDRALETLRGRYAPKIPSPPATCP